jgi:hypothetical protein
MNQNGVAGNPAMNRKNLHRSAVEQEQDGPIRFRLEIGVSASTGACQKDPKATHMRRAEPHRAKIKVGWGGGTPS